MINLCNQLRYDPTELKETNLVTSNDLFLIWLISSHYPSIQSLKLKDVANSIYRNIIAEYLDCSLSTKKIIQALLKRKILLKTIKEINGKNNNYITAYIDECNGSMVEWKSILADCKHCLISN